MSPKLVTLKQCFQSYNERFPKSNEPTARQFLGKFTEAAKEQTVQGWLTEKYMPLGEYKWRCIAFFALLGYPIEPYVRARPLIQRAIELLALDVVPVQTLVSKGFCFESSNATGEMYVVIEKNRAMLPEREIALERFVAEYSEDLLVAKQLFDEQYSTAKLLTAEITPQSELVVMAQPPKPLEVNKPITRPSAIGATKPKLSHDTILNCAANLVQGLLPLLELIDSDAFTPDERAKLRTLSGERSIFRLSNAAEHLCGERARGTLLRRND